MITYIDDGCLSSLLSLPSFFSFLLNLPIQMLISSGRTLTDTSRYVTRVHSNFIHNYLNLETIQMSSNMWIDTKTRYIFAMEHYSAIKNNELLRQGRTWECIMISGKRQTQMVIYCMVLERHVCKGAQRDILWWSNWFIFWLWQYLYKCIHLSKLTELCNKMADFNVYKLHHNKN